MIVTKLFEDRFPVAFIGNKTIVKKIQGEVVMNQNATNELLALREIVREFAYERDWDQFHSPKNLAGAICIEAAELLEPFQWLATGSIDELGDAKKIAVRNEIADVLVYLIRLADKLDIDLFQAVIEKMELSRAKYPVDKIKGDSRKYTEYKD